MSITQEFVEMTQHIPGQEDTKVRYDIDKLIVENNGKVMTYREFRDYYRRDDATVQLSLSKEIVTMKELRQRKRKGREA